MRLAAVILVLALAGCASGSAEPSPSPSPTAVPAALQPGADWVLLVATADPTVVRFGATLRFEETGVSGKAPVNRYSGTAQIGEETLTFGPLASTKMAGPEPAMQAETAFFEAMSKVTNWTVGDDLLTLSDSSGPLLQFAAPDSTGAFAVSLVGKPRAEAKQAAVAAGYEFRVVSVDGKPKAVTMDYRPDRINATIVDGVVTEVTVG